MLNTRYQDSPVNQLASALATYLNGRHKPIGHDEDEFYEGYALVALPAKGDWPAREISLSLRGYGAQKHKLTARLSPAKLSNEVSMRGIDLPECGVSIDRPREIVLREIARRVMSDAGKAALVEYNARIAALYDRDAALKSALATRLAESPNCGTSGNFPISSGAGSVRIFNQGSGAYFHANLYGNGEMSFERVGSINADMARRILAILAEGKAS